MPTTYRLAREQDVSAIGEVSVETWRAAYAHILPPDVLAVQDPERRAQKVLRALANGAVYWVAESGGKVIGFAGGGSPQEPEVTCDTELYAIYVLPEHHGTGVGKALLAHLAESLVHMGHTTMELFVFRDNAVARAFYESTGARLNDEGTFSMGGVDYADCGYVYDSLAALVERLRAG